MRARKLSGDQQEAAAERLTLLLDGWRNAVPEGLRVEDLSSDTPDNVLREFVPLHLAYFLCVFMSHRLQVRNSPWIDRLVAFSYEMLPNTTSTMGLQSDVKLLPTNWSGFVQAARSCLTLVQYISHGQPAIMW